MTKKKHWNRQSDKKKILLLTGQVVETDVIEHVRIVLIKFINDRYHMTADVAAIALSLALLYSTSIHTYLKSSSFLHTAIYWKLSTNIHA